MRYPLPRNRFQADWGGTRIAFSEIGGLGIDVSTVTYREGSSPGSADVVMPGMLRFPNLVFKRTVQKSDNDFYNWINTLQGNTVERRDITVRLLDETLSPVVVWRFRNAFPVKLDYSPLESGNAGPMMEILEIAHEGMTVEND